MEIASVSNAINADVSLATSIPYIIYICSLSMQLSAGLLLVGNVKVTWKGILEEYCSRHRGIVFDESSLKLADYTDIKYVTRTSWTNALAFIYLTFGYLLSMFGETPRNPWNSFGWVIGITFILYIFTYNWSVHKTKCIGEISIKDIPMIGGVGIELIEAEGDNTKNKIDGLLSGQIQGNETDIFSKYVSKSIGEIYRNARRKSRGANMYFSLRREFLEATGGDVDILKAYRMICESDEKTTIDSGYIAIIIAILTAAVSMLPEVDYSQASRHI